MSSVLVEVVADHVGQVVGEVAVVVEFCRVFRMQQQDHSKQPKGRQNIGMHGL